MGRMVLANHDERPPWWGQVVYVQRALPQRRPLHRRARQGRQSPPRAGVQRDHGCFTSHGDGPASRGFHRYGLGDPVRPLVHPTGVGHSLRAVVPPTFYGQNPLPHTGTAALVSLAAAAVLPTAAGHPGPGSGSSGQDALRATVGSSASLFWGAPRALSTRGGGGGGGGILDPRPLSR